MICRISISTYTVPFILIGNKVDLRDDPAVIEELKKNKQRPVKWEEGHSMAEKIGAYAYLECSAMRNSGVREVFDIATRAALLPSKTRRELVHKSLQKKFESIKNFKLSGVIEPKKGLCKLKLDIF